MIVRYDSNAKCNFCASAGAFDQSFSFSKDDDWDDIAWICLTCIKEQLTEIEEEVYHDATLVDSEANQE
ncbi:hypothetical protein LCGC14_0344760 [marine sediment metagenome]|uniref:Uncharacterized protein n=1 Tax=marine sediment metagenome TaxID=412755 RepID=A0A0F9TCN6_9ZZZZ